ncbi:MAG: hypothetical protein ABSE75_03750 [Acidimicrobiales bacterium]|jgi:hypothetical protein
MEPEIMPSLPSVLIPTYTRSVVVVPPPGKGDGYWAGAPSAAVAKDGAIYLAYRVRRPVGEGRGFANVVAQSMDGEHFTTVATLTSSEFDAESLERPYLVPLRDGTWRLYVSAATPGTKHWRIDAVDASTPADFVASNRRTVFPGDLDYGVKDPVIQFWDGMWHAWICFHPLERDDDADRMDTRYATSRDGLTWSFPTIALQGTPGGWDARGARVTAVLRDTKQFVAYYDGRADRESNTEEVTGIAHGTEPGLLLAQGVSPIARSPIGGGAFRYVTIIDLPDNGRRMYYETSCSDGSHELRTELFPSPSPTLSRC